MTCIILLLSLSQLISGVLSDNDGLKGNSSVFRSLQGVSNIFCEIISNAQDDYINPPLHATACIDQDKGEFIDLELKPGTGHLTTGTLVEISGTRTINGKGKADTIHVEKLENLNPPGQGGPQSGRQLIAHTPYTGVRTAIVLILRFTNSSGNVLGKTVDQLNTLAQTVNNTLFGVYSDHSLKTHAGTWSECSYGKLSLAYDVDGVVNDFPNSKSDIFYVDVPQDCTAGVGHCTKTYTTGTACTSNEYYGWPEYALNWLTVNKSGFDRNKWQHKIVIFDTSVGVNCNFVGMGNVGCTSSYCYTWIPDTYAHQPQDYTHELGHNIDLAHGGLNGATGNNLEYGDYSNAMGYCCSVRCYSAPHAYELGWLTPNMTLNDSNFGLGTVYDNVQLQSMSVSDKGSISLTGTWAGGTKYWLQLKTNHAYDKYMSSTWRDNVQIKKWSDTSTYERADDMGVKLLAGQSTQLGTVTITVNAIQGTTATLTLANGEPITPYPTFPITPAPTSPPTLAPTPAPTPYPTTPAPTPCADYPNWTLKLGTGKSAYNIYCTDAGPNTCAQTGKGTNRLTMAEACCACKTP